MAPTCATAIEGDTQHKTVAAQGPHWFTETVPLTFMKTRLIRRLGISHEFNKKKTPVNEGQPLKRVVSETTLPIF